ncbi:unnamed protein product, partial [Mesorhabditis belari]|uniref:Beta-lactamase-related domain-containing protein n=1 Tax=Mesorhabditis belari TaxID=2138241 RepID=A0AAF3EEX6_9BILA
MWLLFELLLVLGKVVCMGTVITHLSALIIFMWKERRLRRQIKVEGFVHPDFKPVLEAFKKNLHKGWERDGAAFTVYYKERLVVDVWGGFADYESWRPWRSDTMSIAFSSSKAVGAICVAMLVDRGLITYEDKVESFWPKFATSGKEEITVKMIMEHTAGLPLIEHKITIEEAMDPEAMASLFEAQRPIWKPGTRVGYHALTYGWLVDLIIRKVDPQHRGIGQFFKEEISIPHDIDFHFGLPIEMTHRVSRIRKPSVWNRLDEWLADPETVDYGSVLKNFLTNGLMLRVADNAGWLQSIFRVTLNNPELYRLEQCAALGIGTARSLARLMLLYSRGHLVSKSIVELTSTPTIIKKKDCVTNAITDRGWGFTHSTYPHKKGASMLIGHSGFGGQNARYDCENDISFAYLSNGLKSGLGDRARPYVHLLRALYSSIPEQNNNNNNNGIYHMDTMMVSEDDHLME